MGSSGKGTVLTRSGTLPEIVVVGGGAGGLELVTRLGNKLGKRGKAAITLVEKIAHASVETAAARDCRGQHGYRTA